MILTGRSKIKLLLAVVVLLMATLPSMQCSSIQKGYHEHFMKGSIIGQSKNEFYICIGTKDGAKVGQILGVYEYVEDPFLYDDHPRTYKRKYIGKIKIISIENEHYARTILLSGKAKKGNSVELE